MKNRLLSVGAVLAVGFVAAPAAAQFSASPAIVWLNPDPTTATGQIVVRNEGPEQTQFRVYSGDFTQGVEGQNEFFAAGSQVGSCGDRLRVTPDVTVLRSGDTQDLRVEVDPGESACWSVIFVQGTPVAASGITVSQRIAVKVYGAASVSAELAAEIVGVEATPSGRGVQVTFEFRNDSASPLRPGGRIELRTLSGEALTQVEIDPFSVLPGQLRRVAVEVPADLEPGRYVAVPVLDFGGDYLAGGQGIFQIL